jgi:hypothetical protein
MKERGANARYVRRTMKNFRNTAVPMLMVAVMVVAAQTPVWGAVLIDNNFDGVADDIGPSFANRSWGTVAMPIPTQASFNWTIEITIVLDLAPRAQWTPLQHPASRPPGLSVQAT